jgi:hypothetical protein
VKLSDVAPAHAVGALGRILELQATDPTASTTVKHVPDAVGVHVADALVALDLPYVAAATRIADLGSGAGGRVSRSRRRCPSPTSRWSSRRSGTADIWRRRWRSGRWRT